MTLEDLDSRGFMVKCFVKKRIKIMWSLVDGGGAEVLDRVGKAERVIRVCYIKNIS